MKSRFNICSASDSYKFQHWNMWPEGTEFVYDYLEARNGARFDKTVFFSLQSIIKDYLTGQVVTEEKIERAKKRINAHLMNPTAFNEAGWRYILEKHNGRLPIEIMAVQEGTPVDVGNALMTVVNTDPKKTGWLCSYLEPMLTHTWYGSTVATLSYEVKKIMKKFLSETSDNQEAIDFMLHDFGFRGATSFESASVGGAGHLVNFKGTDTFSAIDMILDNYSTGLSDDYMPGYSVAATEHGIMISLGRDGEMDVVRNILNKHRSGILSIVIDSYDYIAFIKNFIANFKDEILMRDGKIVFRPDSGVPSDVVMECFELLAENFGYTTNTKGYRVLNPKVGILWGDGIDIVGIEGILYTLKNRGIDVSCMVFGMGGGLLQKVNRDTQRVAYKPSYQVRNGVGYETFKDPISGSKTSKKGMFALVLSEDGMYKTVPMNSVTTNLLEPVFFNGELVRDMNFEQIRLNAA